MSDVTFHEDPGNARIFVPPKGIAGWMIRNKLAKDERAAKLILIIIAVVAASIATFLAFQSPKSIELDSAERLQLERATPLPR